MLGELPSPAAEYGARDTSLGESQPLLQNVEDPVTLTTKRDSATESGKETLRLVLHLLLKNCA